MDAVWASGVAHGGGLLVPQGGGLQLDGGVVERDGEVLLDAGEDFFQDSRGVAGLEAPVLSLIHI